MAASDITSLSVVGNKSMTPGDTIFVDIVKFDGPSSYATGGFPLSTAVKGVIGAGRSIVAVLGLKTGGYKLEYDRANDKVKVYHGDNDAAADGPAVEVPATTDLSTAMAASEMLVISM